MIQLLLSAFLTCVVSLALGQAALRLCGAKQWSWMAAPVGITVAMLLATPAIYLPGRVLTTTVIIAVAAVASAIWCLRVPEHRPPLLGLLAAAPVALIAFVPFLASGHAGTLGVGINNDMTNHLFWVEAYLSPKIQPLPTSYPLGPHAFVAVLCKSLGARADMAFAGFTLALPVIGAWTALHSLRRPTWFGRFLVATVVGIPYLVASYYGEGAFKEVLQAHLVLACALWLDHPVPAGGWRKWMPFAVLLAGVVSVYSYNGLLWPLSFLVLWLVTRGAIYLYSHRGNLRRIALNPSRQLLGVGVAVAVLLLALTPVLKQRKFFSLLTIPKNNIGNLIGPISGWETLGVWDNPDFRLPLKSPFTNGMWTAFVLILVIAGAVWALQQRRWILPAAAVASILIWDYSNGAQSVYVTAKTLVILSPLLLLLAALPLAERPLHGLPWWGVIAPVVALLFWWQISDASAHRVMRYAHVGPTSHVNQMRELRGYLHGESTLFLGFDEFYYWALDGEPVYSPAFNGVPPYQKGWGFGQALDVDTVGVSALNSFKWVIIPRDATQSQPPPQLHLVRTTSDFELWRREGFVAPRSILDEGQYPGAYLDCRKRAVRKLISGGGVAAIRRPPVIIPVIHVVPTGESIRVRLKLSPGAWDLVTPYQSTRPLTVSGPQGVIRKMPGNLDRPGIRWPIGRVVVPRSGSLTLTFAAAPGLFPRLTPAEVGGTMTAIIATRVGTEHVVPLRSACGKYVDWYRTGKG